MKVKYYLFILIFILTLGISAICADAACDPLALPESFENADSDVFLNDIELLTEEKMKDTREIYGISSMKLNDILQKDAEYLAAYLLMSGETDKNGIETVLSPIIDKISYVSGWTYVMSDGFVSTNKEISANFLMKTIMNTDKKHRIFTQNYSVYGFSVATVEREGETILCAVFLGAEDSAAVRSDRDIIPVKWYTDDVSAPRVTQTETVLVKTGTDITDKMIIDSLKITGEKAGVSISYNKAFVILNTAGSYNLPVTVTDNAGNQSLVYVSVRVDNDNPYILSEEIVLPEIPDGEIWNVAFYVECGTQWGGVTVETDPVFLKSGSPLPETVAVTVTNGFGNSVTSSLPVSVGAVSYGAVRCETIESGGQLSVRTIGGSDVQAEGHAILSSGNEKGAIYNYTIISPDGRTVFFTSERQDLVWNPGEPGTYTVLLDVVSHLGERKGSVSQVSVVKRNEIVYNNPVLSFADGCGIVIDGSVVSGIKPETSFASLKEAAVLSGGSGDLSLEAEGTENEAFVYTGFTFTLFDGQQAVSSYTVIIAGDINCDGKVGIADFAKMRQVLLGNLELDSTLTLAGDVNGDGKVGIADFAKMRQFLLGNLEL